MKKNRFKRTSERVYTVTIKRKDGYNTIETLNVQNITSKMANSKCDISFK